MNRRLFFILCSVFVMFSASIIADSLWDGADGSLYSVNKRRIGVGDIVTVFISESTAAVQEATTSTRKDASVGASMINNWDQVANLLGNEQDRRTFEFGIGGDDQYSGAGQTARRSSVKAVLSAVVTEILDSGNLFIVGNHQVKVNNEIETIRVSGIIRPEDISGKNSILSSQIAKAEVSVNGAGVVASKQNPGVMTKMFNWLF